MANCSLFKGLGGIFRIATLVFGFIVLVLTVYFFHGRKYCFNHFSDDDLWIVLLAIVIVTFIVSLTWVVLFILGVIVDSGITKTTDIVWHIIGGVLLIIGGIIWIIAEIQTKRKDSNGNIVTGCSTTQIFFVIIAGLVDTLYRLLSGDDTSYPPIIFGVIDGVVYLIVAFFVWKS